MNVRRLSLFNLMNHGSTEVEFPERGLVLVRGPNGAGKSSVVEAVAVACWGRTLRGAAPWAHGADKCGVRAWVDDLVIHRTRTGDGSPKLSWGNRGELEENWTRWETTTKGQAALEARLGSFDVWRRAAVFSSSDAAVFSAATDAERKRLLERILGLERFDVALDACRSDAQAAAASAAAEEREAVRTRQSLDEQERRAAEARAGLEKALDGVTADEEAAWRLGGAEVAPEPEDDPKVTALIRDAKEELAELRRARDQLIRTEMSAQSRRTQAQERWKRLSLDCCPTCEQPIPSALKQALEGEARKADELAREAAAGMAAAERRIDAQLDELEEEVAALTSRKEQARAAASRARDRAASLRQRVQVVEHFRRTVSDAELRSSSLREKLLKQTEKVAVAARDAEELAAVERVLGMRGVRATVLGESLSGLEVVANRWLEKLGDRVRVQLRPYSEKKAGGVSDAIALTVAGAGGGDGYKGASGGERRRVDVALLLALSEVAGAAAGVTAGTMFFDEAMDALDADGVEAACAVLRELARDRCVVVVAHNEALAAALRPDVRWAVEDGSVRVS